MDELGAGSLCARQFQGCCFLLLSAFAATPFSSSHLLEPTFPFHSQVPVCMCRVGEVLLSHRVKKEVRRFGEFPGRKEESSFLL